MIYTLPMAQQDALVWQDLENIELLNKLQWKIVKDFLKDGNPHGITFNVHLDENKKSVVDTFVPQDQSHFTAHTCKQLIDHLQHLELMFAMTKQEYADFMQMNSLHVNHYVAETVNTDEMFDDAINSKEITADSRDGFYRLEKADGDTVFTGTKHQVLMFVARCVDSERRN